MAAVAEITHPFDRIKVFIWTLTTADPTGDPLVLPTAADKTVQAYGAFGSGTLTLQGANHPSSPTWATLTDQVDNNLSFTDNTKIEVVAQNPFQIRPVLTGSTGASITVLLVVRF